MTDKTFLYVEKLINISVLEQQIDDNISQAGQNWSIVAMDTDLETQIRWHRTNYILGASMVEIQWAIPNYTEPGLYRIRHEGFYKVNCISTFKYF